MGHHGSAFGIFTPFTEVYNKLQDRCMGANNLIMYICCGDGPPWSSLKLYHHVPYDSEEMHTLYSKLRPFFKKWIPSDMGWDQLSREQQQDILNDYLEGFTPSYQVFDDLGSFDANLDFVDGKFHLRLSE